MYGRKRLIMKRSNVFRALILFCVVSVFYGHLCVNANAEDDMIRCSTYEELIQIEHSDLFSQQGDNYYVVYYMEGCPDCEEVVNDICNLAKQETVYAVSYYDNKENIISYNWKEHRQKFDKDIGVLENGEKIFNAGESEEKYLNSSDTNKVGKKVRYEIVVADDTYLRRNPKAIQNHIYASVLTPELNYNDFRDASEVAIAVYPTLLHIEKGKIVESYCDVFEIKEYFSAGLN